MECVICAENFDATDRMPKVLVPCGHTACLRCLGLLPDSRCPTCRLDFNGPPTELPTNFTVLQLLEGVRLESTPRHAEDPAKKILRLLLAVALTE
ncbi:E3 ubiquitin-protein ligase SH3RF1-like, partial [Frankliniella occidentalis]|uniref:E3 ubiquitin-protein ligase SH3RF1-like n=1 Tax=Frankliniella occidentalis TaxID=133901 RepID=A0A9C6WY91_FRAOC